MSVSDEQLDAFIQNQALVAIRRDEIDTRCIQGVPLQFSDQLIRLQYVYDFHIDGQLIVRREDITDMLCRSTDRFQRRLLMDNGLFRQIDFNAPIELTSWSTMLSQLHGTPIVILEQECLSDSQFWMGRLLDVTSRTIRLHEFTGAGRWLDHPTDIPIEAVTCCQRHTNYIKFYADYFDSRADHSAG